MSVYGRRPKQDQLPTQFGLAHPVVGNPLLATFQALAKELHVVLPVSFFEREGVAHFNSIAVSLAITSDSSRLLWHTLSPPSTQRELAAFIFSVA